MTIFWKCWILTFWPHTPGSGGVLGGSAGKIFATVMLHTLFHLTWYATWPCSEKGKFWPFGTNPLGWAWWSAGKIFATMLLNCDYILFDMQHDHVLKKLNFDLLIPPPGLGWEGMWVKYLLPCCCVCHTLQFDIQHDYILKKKEFWSLEPTDRIKGGLRKNIYYHVAACVIPFNLICNIATFWKG